MLTKFKLSLIMIAIISSFALKASYKNSECEFFFDITFKERNIESFLDLKRDKIKDIVNIPLSVNSLSMALKSIDFSKNWDTGNTYFIVLPGNMGQTWKGTNHNIGHDQLIPLLKHFNARGVSEEYLASGEWYESEMSFNSKEYGDDVDINDVQKFVSQPPFYRTNDGEIFYSLNYKGKYNLIFMRRVGFYNDVGNFFVPVIAKLGGKVENMITIHDALDLPVGEIKVSYKKPVRYDGNRAVLSMHNNIGALKVIQSLNNRKEQFKELLKEKTGLEFVESELNQILDNLHYDIWKTIIEAKNQMSDEQIHSKLKKAIRPYLVRIFTSKFKEVFHESEIQTLRDQIEEKKKKIQLAEDKKQAGKEFNGWKKEFVNQNPVLKIAQDIEELGNSKSPAINDITSYILNGFDPRKLNHEFSAIEVGTGYDQWYQKGIKEGFPPLPIGATKEDIGKNHHFVLSKRDEGQFDAQFSQKIIDTLESILENSL